MLAVAAAPLLPWLVATVDVVFTHVPAAVPVTFTENTQDVIGPSDAPERLIVLDPGFAVIIPEGQEPVMPLSGLDTTSPAGRVSVNEMPLSGVIVSTFMRVNVSVVWSFRGMLGIPNAFVSVGAVKAFAELVVKASATHASMIHLILGTINIF